MHRDGEGGGRREHPEPRSRRTTGSRTERRGNGTALRRAGGQGAGANPKKSIAARLFGARVIIECGTQISVRKSWRYHRAVPSSVRCFDPRAFGMCFHIRHWRKRPGTRCKIFCRNQKRTNYDRCLRSMEKYNYLRSLLETLCFGYLNSRVHIRVVVERGVYLRILPSLKCEGIRNQL